jgi:hypothetical protein
MKAIGIILTVAILLGGTLPGSFDKKAKRIIKKSFDSDNIEMEVISLDDTFDDRPDVGLQLFSLTENEETVGHLLITTAKGRYEYFDYLVLYNPDLSIRLIEVLEYRSEYGFEITSKKWLKQFVGMSGCGLEYAEDIDALSGATYSASSITSDLGFLCEYLPGLLLRK